MRRALPIDRSWTCLHHPEGTVCWSKQEMADLVCESTCEHHVGPAVAHWLLDLAKQRGDAEYELVEPGDEKRLFYRLPWWKKVIVMAGGPMVNLVLAFALFGAVFMIYGAPVITTTVDEVSDCVVAVTPENRDQPQRKCTDADPVAPAKQAGIQPGDEILAFNGEQVESWEELTTLIRGNADGDARILVERDGEQVTLTTNTTVSARPESAESDRIVEVGFLGVVPEQVIEKQGPVFVVTTMGEYTWRTLEALAQLPVKLWGVAKAAVGVEERADDSPMSVVGASRVTFRVIDKVFPRALISVPLGPPGFRVALDILVYWSLVGACQAITNFRRSQERERRAAELEARLTSAKLQALRMQINPHFLFNTMNTIAALIPVAPNEAEQPLVHVEGRLRQQREIRCTHEARQLHEHLMDVFSQRLSRRE